LLLGLLVVLSEVPAAEEVDQLAVEAEPFFGPGDEFVVGEARSRL